MNSDAAPFRLLGACDRTMCFHHCLTLASAPKGHAHLAQENARQYVSLVNGHETSRWSADFGSCSHSKQIAVASRPRRMRRSAVQIRRRQANHMNSLTRSGAQVCQISLAPGKGGLSWNNDRYADLALNRPSGVQFHLMISSRSAYNCTSSRHSQRCRYWMIALTDIPPVMSRTHRDP
jgi:hypothetical protein